MSELKLSIILPFYNVEKYIAQCLDSLYVQDIPESEYEVICVNDCSPDGTRDIVVEYQMKHKNLILIDHEVNKKQGGGRNTGLRAAKGNYVWFIDSDDFIKNNIFSRLLNITESYNLEILHFNTQRITNNGEISEYQFFPQNTDVISGIDFINNDILPYWKKHVMPWSKIFKTKFLLDNDLFFPEHYFWEDNIHTLRSLLACKKLQYITDKIHYYRDNPTSDMNTNYLGGIKLADKVRVEVECIAILEAWREKDNEIADFLIPMYTYHLKGRKKAILYFSVSELRKFYKRLSNIERRKFTSHLKLKDYFIYIYPLPIRIFNFVLMQPLRFIRNLKRTIVKQ